MKVETIKRFRDMKEDKVREIGSTFEVSKERFEEINSTSFGIMVKQTQTVKETKDNE